MIPHDIKQVIERLKTRGLIKVREAAPATWRDTDATHKTPRKDCKWCGKNISAVFGHHVCKPRRMSLKHLLLAMLLPLCAMSQSKTNVPMQILDARVSFILPAGKDAKVYTRPSSKDKWVLWQMVPRNTLPLDQGVVLALPPPIAGTTQCQVTFQ
jgi:hypothetical protein